jgi:hypothetical protein
MSGQHHAPAALYPGQGGGGNTVILVQGAGQNPEPIWTQRLVEKSSASVGDQIPVAQSVVRHYTDSANRLNNIWLNVKFNQG